MDDPPLNYLDSPAHEAARRHPLLMAAWYAAEYVNSLALATQDAIEAKLRRAATPDTTGS